MLWELRYRAPRSVDNVLIETEGDTEAEAKELADWYLSTLTSPSVRFIYVRPIVVASTKSMRKAKSAKAAPATTEDDGPNPAQSASRGQQGGRVGS